MLRGTITKTRALFVVIVIFFLHLIFGFKFLGVWTYSIYGMSPNQTWSAVISRTVTNTFPTTHRATQRVNSSAITHGRDKNHAARPTVEKSQAPGGNMRNVTVNCRFPKLDPFDPKIMPLIHSYPPVKCGSNTPSVVDVVDDVLRINPSKVTRKLKVKKLDYCKYRTIGMKSDHKVKAHFGPWSSDFDNSIRVGESEEYLQVECYLKGNLLTRSYHSITKKKPAVEKVRLASFKKHLALNSPKETLNLLFVGVDAVSRENSIRAFPKSRQYLLKEMKAIEFTQLNKLGLNTFPNVIPLLTGMTEEEFISKGWTIDKPFDRFHQHFIWSQYQQAGYRVSYQSEAVTITAFHYQKKGWRNPPFDHYLRPLNVASEYDQLNRRESIHCLGDETEVAFMLDYYRSLMTTYNATKDTPYFFYTFFSRLSHDDHNVASRTDADFPPFFRRLQNQNLLHNTLLVFFSDHGARYGTFRNTVNGVYEARHPMLFFVFPPWFERKYPQVMANFRKNADRLMTFFDLHETLEDLLKFTGKPRPVLPTDRGISLFSEIPTNRTCASAGIPVKFCGCMALSSGNSTSPTISRHLVDAMMKQINKETDGHRDKCVPLKLKETVRVSMMTHEVPFTNKYQSLYHVTIQVSPGDGLFEASFIYKSDDHKVDIVGHVSRTSLYRGQAECVQGGHLRSYCFCRDRLQGPK